MQFRSSSYSHLSASLPCIIWARPSQRLHAHPPTEYTSKQHAIYTQTFIMTTSPSPRTTGPHLMVATGLHQGRHPLSGSQSSPQLACLDHSLDPSLTVPTFNLGVYFFRTCSLWYFQNCLDASLPATRFRILDPPGCSSMNSMQALACCANVMIDPAGWNDGE